MLTRVLEPEVMDTAEEARDYDDIDHSEVNTRYCDDLIAFAGDALRGGSVLDVGTGTARIPILLCQRVSGPTVVGIDLSGEMLAIGHSNVAAAGLADRITLQREDAKRLGKPDFAFQAVLCNTIIHHIPRPGELLSEMWRLTAKGGVIFARDLVRPESDEGVLELVQRHGGKPATTAPNDVASHRRQVALFDASFRASLTLGEIRELARAVGIPPEAVTMTSDRHWTLAARRER
jgi:ubiquinone/menaquinone biosynthesis C-methylase UbiE